MKNNKEANTGKCVCPHCGTEGNFKDNVIGAIEHIITEKERVCNACDGVMDVWAYGHWENLPDDVGNDRIDPVTEEINYEKYNDFLQVGRKRYSFKIKTKKV